MAKPKWICVQDPYHGRTFSCSICNFIIPWTPNLPTRYCPECGANMIDLYGKPDVIKVKAVLEQLEEERVSVEYSEMKAEE